MRLALNFQRVDPSRGGAETYVADLCGQLVRLGHQVDLYAESWREGVLPAEVRCIAVEAPGRTRDGPDLELRQELRGRLARGPRTTARSASSTPGTTT